MLRKIVLLASLMGALTFSSKSQELGIRFGDALGNNVAVDGVFSVAEFSRVHANVSFGNGIGIEALYDFYYRPVGDVQGLDWYVGAGPSLFLGDNYFGLGISGEVGIEYHFNEALGVPIALGLDWRPTVLLIEDTDFYAGGFGLNIRYVFGN